MNGFDKNIGGYLSKSFSENKGAHAYIIVGEKQTLITLLYECAIARMCKNGGFDNCETCAKITKGEHQDVIRLPQDTQKNRLTVSDMSYLAEESFKRPVDNDSIARVFLVDASDSTTGIGAELWQNKLLKTLEEPSDGVYIFIGVTDVEGLLPTVRSRCQVLRQTKLNVGDVKTELLKGGFDERYCEIAAAMSGGSVSAGERLLNNPNVFSAYEVAIDIVENMSSTKNALQFASRLIACKEYVFDALSMLTALYRESVVYRLNEKLCLFPSLKQTIDKTCANYTIEAARTCIEIINDTKKALDSSGNVSIVIDKLLNRLLEIKYRCRQ